MQDYIIGENQHQRYAFVIDKDNGCDEQHYYFYLECNAHLDAEFLIVNTSIELTIECILAGHGAQARITGAYGVRGLHKVKINTIQHHQAAHTSSTLAMRGVLYDEAHAHYHGTITVEHNAHGCDASQENKNMVMSNNARAVSEPQLQVLTDDVRCFHGSATGRCDDEQLFYCATRGIDEKRAQQLLLGAFFDTLFGDRMMKEKVLELIE